jgi:hypothetical protein
MQKKIKGGSMKIKFDVELRDSLKRLRESLGTHISDAKMTKIFADGCGEQCKVTCAWYCRSDIVTEEIVVEPE